ncbi:hypothetical protein SAMN05660489_06264 [Pseudomonas sp. LAMO17WK12:I10]|jgi:hypothetical protein|uniref:hypothetical protein n=1 Tax=unclassified Pseudomonas TaxID=196821 RepID=UPI000BCC8997|nr:MULTISPECIES: hypothetical protein [unclassified Pseudomonas]PXX51836.1 hypothetical protein H160_06276 [Pseudomonas sp. LAMO17WK12:I9]SNY53612.1 hypothetical protein SAMN05660489_06264 [Pseudomonas sp. LAMO17WK12:I10]
MLSLRKPISKVLIAVIATVGGAFLEASTDLIKKNFEPALVGTRNSLEDWFSPLPHDALLGISLETYMPSASGDKPWAESVSATIPAKRCRDTGWPGIVRAFDPSPNGHSTNAVITIRCRPSGRVEVALAPQSGETIKIYEGRFKDGDKIGFPGVPGSYYAGVLTMHRLETNKPEGPWQPVNECQVTNTCKPDDFRAN